MDITDVTLAAEIKQVLTCQSENQQLRRELADRERLIASLLRRLEPDDTEYEIVRGQLQMKSPAQLALCETKQNIIKNNYV
ncbi:MAG: hypothetical protein HFE63_10850 [Clostridiales bacterium]|nr:hypothetical protein [Clostridiales bacterium]